MTATLLNSATFAFADGGGAGHVCNLVSAPTAGQLDVLCVNSNTTVATPAGWTAAPTSVGGQGAYIFRRIATGGEGSTVTITTAGAHNTAVVWSRWDGIVAADTAVQTSVNGVAGAVSPVHSTGVLAAGAELVIAFAALHSFTVAPTSPVWSAGYTPLAVASQLTGAGDVVGMVAYRVDAGPTAENPSVTWINVAADRYTLTLTATTVAPLVVPPGVHVAGGTSTTLTAAAATPAALTAANAAPVVLTASGTP